MKLVLGELVTDHRVPTFVAGIMDPEFPSSDGPIERLFSGWGTDLDPRRAVLRAITEAVQGRVLVMQGARDTFEGGQSIERMWTLRRLVEFYLPSRLHPFDADTSRSSWPSQTRPPGRCLPSPSNSRLRPLHCCGPHPT